MKNNANLIIAAVVMMGFLMFWESTVMSRYNTRPKPASVTTSAVEKAPMTPADVKIVDAVANLTSNPIEESLTVLETPTTKVSILSKGARVASWQVKERDHWIELVVPEKQRVVSPLETFPDINFSSHKQSASKAVFSATLPNGAHINKEINLLAQPPLHAVTVTLSNPTKNELSVVASLPLGNGIDKHEVHIPYDPKAGEAVAAETRAVGLAAKVKSWKPGFIFGRHVDMTDPDTFKWAGVDNNHFLNALLPVPGASLTNIKVVADRKHPPMISVPMNATLKPGASERFQFHLYAGAKDYNELLKLNNGLDQAVDFGFFGVIAKMLLRALNFFDGMTKNYGWAIIILTFCIQLLVFPLTKKNLMHSVRMRELQPHIKKLQEQYKGDPKRLQVETFNFYKKNGMKFMGMEGCFPMLLQLPIFFAFYSTLHVAYELRGAPWIFWIKDLGVHDPYYVLPIIMGGGMLLQQKMTAVVMDPAQARMMMFMPIIFTFMFLNLPAGLVLYWCVNSLVTIGIQLALGTHKNTSSPQLAS